MILIVACCKLKILNPQTNKGRNERIAPIWTVEIPLFPPLFVFGFNTYNNIHGVGELAIDTFLQINVELNGSV